MKVVFGELKIYTSALVYRYSVYFSCFYNVYNDLYYCPMYKGHVHVFRIYIYIIQEQN